MSGIFGYVQNRNLKQEKIDIQSMNRWNRAYGNEGEEVFEGKEFGIGCSLEKLSVDAVKSAPVIKKDKKVAVIDAVLYNREEISERCEVTTPCSDEELLLCCIEKYGVEGLKEVNGDFSGAVYDGVDGSLLLFRDHMGVRPLYYYASDECVVFSTDIRGLISVKEVDVSVNEEWLYKYIAGYTTGSVDQTEFQHVFCVEPGGIIRFSFEAGRLYTEKKKYWTIGEKKIRYKTEKEYIDRLRELVTDSVKRRLDVISGTVGAELSGGLDSGVIDILINRFGRKGVYFSWSVAPEEVPYAEADERLVIKDICEQENISCNFGKAHIDLNEASMITRKTKDILPELNMEEHEAFRYVWLPYINSAVFCETAECIRGNGARTVFTGHGGDEGVSHRCNSYELFYHREYLHYFKQEWDLVCGQKPRAWRFIKRCGKTLIKTRRKFKTPFRRMDGAPELLRGDFAEKFASQKMPLMTFAYDAKNYIVNGGSRNRLDNVALLGAYSGVRYIVPYLDYRVVDFAVSIPRHLYLRDNQNRYIFREAFKDIMPESLYTLRVKQNNSQSNMQKVTDHEARFLKIRTQLMNKLNRVYWGKYLDFNLIDKWSGKDTFSGAERETDMKILTCLLACGMVQNLVEKTRGEKME